MKTIEHNRSYYSKIFLLSLCSLLLSVSGIYAQTQPGSPLDLPGDKKADTLQFDKTNTDEWHSDNVQFKLRYKLLNSEKQQHLDSTIHSFHRKPYSQPWYMNLGNFGTASRNLMFTPEDRLGPTLGYNAMDVYRIKADSLKFYNTTTPYTLFAFRLGSKQEQFLQILHTQNIKPNWNFSFEYNKISSKGYFLLQRTSHDMGSFTTNYESINHRYKMKAAFVYNKDIQDENGGIKDTSLLTNEDYNERSNIDIVFDNAVSGSNSSVPRSLVVNSQRDYTVIFRHGYSWGQVDSLYNEDSTKMTVEFTPRFGISHHFKHSNQQYTYKDKAPDSLRYTNFFERSFEGDGSDSVFMRQKQNTFDNTVLLDGFIGKKDKQAQFSAGLGIRFDEFATRYVADARFDKYTSNYVVAQLRKEALQDKEWFYNANAKFYVTGIAAGNSLLHVSAGRQFGDSLGIIEAGVQQNINNAPFSYTFYINQFDTISNTFNKESVTKVYIHVGIERIHASAGVRNYLMSNYLYINQNQVADQYASTINLLQVYVQKAFKFKGFVLDNELVYQQLSAFAPINVPQLMGRHQLSYEKPIFKNALQIATGVEARYYSKYNTAAYSPIFHRYYYQNTYALSNVPVIAYFFNFRIKRFRSFIMLDQIQQAFVKKNFITTPGYPAQDLMLRFGFNWALLF